MSLSLCARWGEAPHHCRDWRPLQHHVVAKRPGETEAVADPRRLLEQLVPGISKVRHVKRVAEREEAEEGRGPHAELQDFETEDDEHGQ